MVYKTLNDGLNSLPVLLYIVRVAETSVSIRGGEFD